MDLDELGALLVFFPLLRRALSRMRNGDAAFFGDQANGFWKSALLHFHYEFENVAAHAAAEAVVDLLGGMNGE